MSMNIPPQTTLFQKVRQTLMPCCYSAAAVTEPGRDTVELSSSSPAPILRNRAMSDASLQRIEQEAQQRLLSAKPADAEAEDVRHNVVTALLSELRTPDEGGASDQACKQALYARLQEIHQMPMVEVKSKQAHLQWEIGFRNRNNGAASTRLRFDSSNTPPSGPQITRQQQPFPQLTLNTRREQSSGGHTDDGYHAQSDASTPPSGVRSRRAVAPSPGRNNESRLITKRSSSVESGEGLVLSLDLRNPVVASLLQRPDRQDALTTAPTQIISAPPRSLRDEQATQANVGSPKQDNDLTLV